MPYSLTPHMTCLTTHTTPGNQRQADTTQDKSRESQCASDARLESKPYTCLFKVEGRLSAPQEAKERWCGRRSKGKQANEETQAFNSQMTSIQEPNEYTQASLPESRETNSDEDAVSVEGQVTCIGRAIRPTRLCPTTFHDAKGLYLRNSPHTQHAMHNPCQLAQSGAQQRGTKHKAHKLQSTTGSALMISFAHPQWHPQSAPYADSTHTS